MFTWVPLREAVGLSAEIGRVQYEARLWQLVEERRSGGAILLLRRGGDIAWQTERDALFAQAADRRIELPCFELDALVFGGALACPIPLERLALRSPPVTAEELSTLGPALKDVRTRRPGALLPKTLFIAELAFCLADQGCVESQDLMSFAQEIVTGGIRSPRLSTQQMHAVNPWVEQEDISRFLEALGLPGRHANRRLGEEALTAVFRLPGCPALEKLLQEEVIDYWRRRPRYTAMGIAPPAGLLLHGPPGSGKTYAVSRLAEFLDWRVFDLGSGSVGSALAHETPKMIASLFAQAEKAAPAIVLVEEFDAFGGDRSGLLNDFRREEAATLLREVEASPQRGILVVATTNDLSAVDAAFLRKGRFDYVFEVGYPGSSEVLAVLEDLLANRPTTAGFELGAIAKQLTGRSLADARWLVDRAARIAVSEDKSMIDELCLQRAMRMLEER